LIVVIDASTFVSAALKADSLPERALLRAVDAPNRLILSQAVEDEYREAIFRAKFDRFVSVERRQRILDIVVVAAERIEPTETVRECHDPKDDKYLALAAAGNADVIVSSDARHLLSMDPWRDTHSVPIELSRPRVTAAGQGRFRSGFLWPRGFPDGLEAAQHRGLLPGIDQGLHLRPDLPRRELEHQPSPRRVLDDRAGDRVRRPLGQCGIGGSTAEIHLRGVYRRIRLADLAPSGTLHEWRVVVGPDRRSGSRLVWRAPMGEEDRDGRAQLGAINDSLGK